MPKRIIICCDGTWNTPDQEDGRSPVPTNVVKLERSILPESPPPNTMPQVVFYDAGVGTGSFFDKIFGGAFGKGLDKNILLAYRFLVSNFELGDELFLFGFSRGAYTARSLAGLIRNSGIVKKIYSHMIPAANELYRRRDDASHPREEEAKKFRQDYSWETRIRFIGVWDTVGSLGIPGRFRTLTSWKYRFHDVELSSWMDNAFQALAIDEKRKAFEPAIWTIQQGVANQTVEQFWFAGVHCDVGGGYKETELSDIALLWMLDRGRKCGLAVDTAPLQPPVAPDPIGVLHDSMKWYYIPLGKSIRKITLNNPESNESVNQSAIDRYNADQKYRPENWPIT